MELRKISQFIGERKSQYFKEVIAENQHKILVSNMNDAKAQIAASESD